MFGHMSKIRHMVASGIFASKPAGSMCRNVIVQVAPNRELCAISENSTRSASSSCDVTRGPMAVGRSATLKESDLNMLPQSGFAQRVRRYRDERSCRGEMAREGSSGVAGSTWLLSAWLEKALYRCGSAKRYRVLEARQMFKRVERDWSGIQEFSDSYQWARRPCAKGNAATCQSIRSSSSSGSCCGISC